MDFLNPAVFLFSSALVGVSILLLLVISRPGLPADHPALGVWVLGDLAFGAHRLALLLQPGIVLPQAAGTFGLTTIDFLTADAAFLTLGLALEAKALSLLCRRPLRRWGTVVLLAVPALCVALAMRLLPGTSLGQIMIFVVCGSLNVTQIALAWRARAGSRGLTMLMVANASIIALLLMGLAGVLAHLGEDAAAPAGVADGPFLPHLFGILSDFVASIVRTFAISLVLQERQRAHMTLLSTTDALTGALNRHGALPVMQQALASALRQRQPISLAIIDIDHFKRVNDSFGHDAGDAVLAAFAQGLKASKRESDMLARWGGEEFVLLLPGTAAQDAATLLDRLRVELPARLAAQAPCPVTFSAGIAALAPGAVNPSANAHAVGPGADLSTLVGLLSLADRRLYQAKVTRDCVVWEGPERGLAPGPAGPLPHWGFAAP